MIHHALRLRLDSAALVANWRWLQRRAGVAAGAAVKADGYGLGAREVVARLGAAGCRDFFVSTWAEAEALGALPGGREPERASRRRARRPRRRAGQHGAAGAQHAGAGRAVEAGGAGRPCDVMVDTGMNRLGLRADEIDLLDGLAIDTLMSHLACADEDHAMNAVQRDRFAAVAAAVPAKRYSLANSAGICLGRDYAFDLVRPGTRALRRDRRATRRSGTSRRSPFPRPK